MLSFVVSLMREKRSSHSCGQKRDFYLLIPENRAPECWDSSWGVGRTPPRTDIGGSASPENPGALLGQRTAALSKHSWWGLSTSTTATHKYQLHVARLEFIPF